MSDNHPQPIIHIPNTKVIRSKTTKSEITRNTEGFQLVLGGRIIIRKSGKLHIILEKG
jgi:hypothetical protein